MKRQERLHRNGTYVPPHARFEPLQIVLPRIFPCSMHHGKIHASHAPGHAMPRNRSAGAGCTAAMHVPNRQKWQQGTIHCAPFSNKIQSRRRTGHGPRATGPRLSPISRRSDPNQYIQRGVLAARWSPAPLGTAGGTTKNLSTCRT